MRRGRPNSKSVTVLSLSPYGVVLLVKLVIVYVGQILTPYSGSTRPRVPDVHGARPSIPQQRARVAPRSAPTKTGAWAAKKAVQEVGLAAQGVTKLSKKIQGVTKIFTEVQGVAKIFTEVQGVPKLSKEVPLEKIQGVTKLLTLNLIIK